MTVQSKRIDGAGATISSGGDDTTYLVPILPALRLMGKMTALATKAAEKTAHYLESVVQGVGKVIVAPISKSSSLLRGGANSNLRRIDAEKKKVVSQIDDLCLKLGRKINELPPSDTETLAKNPKLKTLLSSLQECREKIKSFEKERSKASVKDTKTVKAVAKTAVAKQAKTVEKESKTVEAQGTDLTLLMQMKNLIAKSPEGLSLTIIGERLNVKWRTLIPVAKEAIDRKLIKKKGRLYYPVN